MRRPTLGAAAAAAAAVLAGCTPAPTPSQPTAISPAPSSTDASTPVTTGDSPAGHGSLAQCLHQHGVPESAGSAVIGPPASVDPGVWEQARKACSALQPGPAS
ncbi:hypothetical protein ORI20_00865 [Mycobacterium sp. CVI_P3]|uniref:Lipoprotein n=1 Tax=Mycobacterium pinniadriaticum TaxID=2994102 RepID=A0ABT3S751_9MYCO|nr:hypothetical protein [Mycobacterium pinniadriaticum]MCX2928805.1 hypothetical protein [Mycobacterium pinniadriaticum]MCX2935328.1 hypothetical protein [Mycobacterium pinniadriaticum]